MKKVIDYLHSNYFSIYTSVITITEILPKPVSLLREDMVKKFMGFLSKEEDINLLTISSEIAEDAGRLRGKYGTLKTMDAIQIAAAKQAGVDFFLTNDVKLKQIKEIKVVVLKDYF
jgi:predicted nucleic acid-binding protein